MKKKVVFVALLAFVLTSCAAAQEDRNSYYYAEGQQVRVVVAPNSVAVRFSIAPDAELIASIGRENGLVENKEERYSPLRRHSTVVYTAAASPITNRYLVDLQDRLRRGGAPVADVGRLVTTETGAVAVLTDQLSIGFIDGVTGLADLRGLDVQRSVTEIRTLNPRPLVVSYRVNADTERTPLEIANAVYEYLDSNGRRLVLYAAPTLRFPAELRTVPNQPQPANDDHYPEQWHLDNQFLADINAPEAWDYTRGSTDVPDLDRCVVTKRVRIAVFDNGVDTDHEDLVDNMSTDGRDYTVDPVGEDPNPDPLDPVTNPDPEHGTQAAGVIAACGHNHLGVSGVCPLCEILPIKVDAFDAAATRDAFYDAVNQLNADVISNSWGAPQSPELMAALPIITGTNPPAPGIPVFFAVPNDVTDSCSTDLSGLGSVIAVSGSSNVDKAGLSGGFGDCVDLVAPTQQGTAGKIVTTNLADKYGDSFSGFGGTSASTAVVAGVAGLVLSLNPSLTQQNVRDILQHTAAKIPLVPLGELYVNGFSPRAGYGRVDAHRAVVPVVKIVAPKLFVQVNEPFSITVSASAPHLLSSIGWSRRLVSCDAVEEWRAVSGEAFHEETWSGLTLSSPGVYFFRPNAKDSLWPVSDGYPHIASDAFPSLPEVMITVQGLGTPASCSPPISGPRPPVITGVN